VLVYALYAFFTKYMSPAKKLAITLLWIRDTVNTMRNSEPHIRQAGLNKIFKNTFLEENWKEFSRTLHEYKFVDSEGVVKIQHRSTVPVSYFFTASAIIDKPLKVQYFKHLPGILTGVGIIGTFAGLLFGLTNFDATTPDSINRSVGLLLSGVRDAFYASAFAITASMVVTHLEKLSYQRCLHNLEELNSLVGKMFDSGVLEEYLATLSSQNISVEVKRFGDQLNESLRDLNRSMATNSRNQAETLVRDLAKVIQDSNDRLANQIENSLVRQVRNPLESFTDLVSKNVQSKSAASSINQKEIIKKIILANKDSSDTSITREEAQGF
ncbi:MAG: hypothetical protein ACK5Q1_09010, partial [Limnobacter sp.]